MGLLRGLILWEIYSWKKWKGTNNYVWLFLSVTIHGLIVIKSIALSKGVLFLFHSPLVFPGSSVVLSLFLIVFYLLFLSCQYCPRRLSSNRKEYLVEYCYLCKLRRITFLPLTMIYTFS